jgi:hypothetical protein
MDLQPGTVTSDLVGLTVATLLFLFLMFIARFTARMYERSGPSRRIAAIVAASAAKVYLVAALLCAVLLVFRTAAHVLSA